jgi:hypothetical protein
VSDWLDPVRAALDGLDRRVACFVRDDDGGWADERLVSILDVFERHAMPIDVAVIPDALTPELARSLVERVERGSLHLHQHGRAHVNHEPPERRKCEFGPARTTDELHHDVAEGWSHLVELLGDTVEPVFTPPWNRCVDELAPILADVGHRVLSRDHTAATIGHGAVRETPVNVDWFGSTKGERCTRSELAARTADRLTDESVAALGLMLHHAITDGAELADVESLVALLADHPMIEPTSILAHATPRTEHTLR